MPTGFGYIDTKDFISQLASARTSSQWAIYHAAITVTRLKAGLPCDTTRTTVNIEDSVVALKQCADWLQDRGYIIANTRPNLHAMRDNAERHCVDTGVNITYTKNTLNALAYGDATEVVLIKNWVKTSFVTKGSMILTADSLNRDGDVRFNEKYVSATTESTARDSFYPWLSVSLADYFKAFMAADESVLVLFGPPGTGKSTFLRSLILSGHYTGMLAYSRAVVEAPSLITQFYNGRPDILAYEDIDVHLNKREDGNLLMATLLNASDGVVQHPGKKIVFSTNLPDTNKIDPALLRVGRCFDILEFRHLTPDQSDAVLYDLGRAPKDFSGKKSWSLAEVLNKDASARQVTNRFARKVGF